MANKNKLYFLWLSLACVIVFVLQNLIKGFTDLFVLNLKAVYEFQIWRFLTAIFLHSSVVHIAYNLFALLLFGFILEKKIGSKNFLIVFFVSGILGNLIAVNFYSSSLGASGAIYGILGCLTIISPLMIVWAFGIIMPMFVAAILWVLGGVFGVFGMFNDNTGYVAHLSGIFAGVLIGLFLRIKNKDRFRKIRETNKINLPEDYMRMWEDRFMR